MRALDEPDAGEEAASAPEGTSGRERRGALVLVQLKELALLEEEDRVEVVLLDLPELRGAGRCRSFSVCRTGAGKEATERRTCVSNGVNLAQAFLGMNSVRGS